MPYSHAIVADNQERSYNPQMGLWYREGTTDLDIAREMPAYAPLGVQPGEWVLDAGANIGAYAREAIINQKAGFVVCFEPDPENFELLRRNTAELSTRTSLFQGAVLGVGRGEPIPSENDTRAITFYKNRRRCKASHSTVEFNQRDVITVRGWEFQALLERFNFNRIKMDVEGEEHYILPTVRLPASVQGILCEVHLNTPAGAIKRGEDWRYGTAPEIDRNLRSQGFKPVDRLPMKIGEKNWHCLACYRRDI